MSDLTLTPIHRPFRATVAPPGSKSLTNRALVLAALADGESQLSNVLFAEDTTVMLESLAKLGFELQIDRTNHKVSVKGRNGAIGTESAELFCGNSGTTIRFLSALCSLGHGSYTLDGIARMRQRPIRDLGFLLSTLGTSVNYLQNEGFPPLRIDAAGLPGGAFEYASTVSSQYLSAVLMVSPYAQQEVEVTLVGEQTSWPYVAMTMQLMDRFGRTVELLRDPNTRKPKKLFVPQGSYRGTNYVVEPDASNAAYFFAAAAINPSSQVKLRGLGKESLQGDVGLVSVLAKMGAEVRLDRTEISVAGTNQLKGIDIDLRDMPDQAQTLAVVALFAQGKTTLRGLHTLKVKETDRLAAVATELQKFGANVLIEGGDTLIITPGTTTKPLSVDTYDDHRMAMSFAVAGTRLSNVTINDIECVNKTYPEFFTEFSSAISSSANV